MAPRKGPMKGTGGHNRRRLEGKGPTPPAEERPGHPAQRRARAASRRAGTATAGRPPGGRAAGGRGRDREGPEDVVAGRNAVVEALRANVPATSLYVASGGDRDRRVEEAMRIAVAHDLTVLEGSRSDLDRIAGGAPHQGIALVVRPFDYAHPDDLLRRVREGTTTPLVVALDGVTDPHNLGAIARSAAAFGAQGLLLPERRAAGVTPAAWKASAGALARLEVARATNLVRTLTSYAAEGLMVVGLDGRGELDLADLELATSPLVLVVGAEGRGLSRLVAERCDVTVRIPLPGGFESLNASVAAGIALAEVARRRTG